MAVVDHRPDRAKGKCRVVHACKAAEDIRVSDSADMPALVRMPIHAPRGVTAARPKPTQAHEVAGPRI